MSFRRGAVVASTEEEYEQLLMMEEDLARVFQVLVGIYADPGFRDDKVLNEISALLTRSMVKSPAGMDRREAEEFIADGRDVIHHAISVDIGTLVGGADKLNQAIREMMMKVDPTKTVEMGNNKVKEQIRRRPTSALR